jgi:microcompartment protein CcmL/EutN
VTEGRAVGAPFLVQWAYIPNIHGQVVEALSRRGGASGVLGSLGVLEATSLASALHAADAAAKTSAVRILELTFDLDLGGKMYCTLTGELADVEAAMDAGERQLRADGAFLHREIVARPHRGMDAIVLCGQEKPCS